MIFYEKAFFPGAVVENNVSAYTYPRLHSLGEPATEAIGAAYEQCVDGPTERDQHEVSPTQSHRQ